MIFSARDRTVVYRPGLAAFVGGSVGERTTRLMGCSARAVDHSENTIRGIRRWNLFCFGFCAARIVGYTAGALGRENLQLYSIGSQAEHLGLAIGAKKGTEWSPLRCGCFADVQPKSNVLAATAKTVQPTIHCGARENICGGFFECGARIPHIAITANYH